jgi:regulator of sigma E protease
MFTGNVSVDDMSGPVGIISTIGEAAQRGFADVLWIMILISLNLGVVNLLPLPALDGGRIIFTLIEMFTKRKPKPAVEGYIHTAGFALLILFMLYVTKNDIVRLFVK